MRIPIAFVSAILLSSPFYAHSEELTTTEFEDQKINFPLFEEEEEATTASIEAEDEDDAFYAANFEDIELNEIDLGIEQLHEFLMQKNYKAVIEKGDELISQCKTEEDAARKNNISTLIIAAHIGLGNVETVNEFIEELKCQTANDLEEQSSITNMVASHLESGISIHRQDEELQKAFFYKAEDLLQECLYTLDENENQVPYVLTLTHFALLETDPIYGDNSKAEEALINTLPILTELEWWSNYHSNMIQLGRVYLSQGNLSQCKDIIEHLNATDEDAPVMTPSDQIQFYYFQAEVAIFENDTDLANKFRNIAQTIIA